MSSVPSSSSLSISFGSMPRVRSISSGSALRIGSVDWSQLELRTRTTFLPGSMDLNMYGPEEIGWSAYLSPLSLAAGTGAAPPIASRYGKSAKADLRWKTIVLSSGVSTDLRPSFFGSVSLYGPG